MWVSLKPPKTINKTNEENMFDKKVEKFARAKKIYVGSFVKDQYQKIHAKMKRYNVYGYQKCRGGIELWIKVKYRKLTARKGKEQMSLKFADQSLCDIDKNYVISVMANRYKRHIQDLIDNHKNFIDSEDERIEKCKQDTIQRKKVVDEYEKILKQCDINAENYHWKVDNDLNITNRPLLIQDQIEQEEQLYL